ncbi:hypothetical protein D3C73_1116340 [compost metagenome]
MTTHDEVDVILLPLYCFIDYSPCNIDVVNFKQCSKQVCSNDTFLSVLDTIQDILMVFQSVEYEWRQYQCICFETCLACHEHRFVGKQLNWCGSRLVQLNSFISTWVRNYTRDLTRPNTRSEVFRSPFHFATHQHLLGNEVVSVCVCVQRIIVVSAILFCNVLMERLNFRVVRSVRLNAVVTASRFSSRSTHTSLIAEEVSFVILEVYIGLFFNRNHLEYFCSDKCILILHIRYGHIC